MLTDWVLIARMASELRERIVGARVEDAGLLTDGRWAIVLRKAGRRSLLAFDLFASPPMITLEEGELGIAEEPGFIRSLARSLRGTIVAQVVARRDDRLLRLRFASRSRFGVGEELDLYIELVPRFGNAVLVKGPTIVAAAKEFGAADNPARAILAGSAYVMPPVQERPRVLSASGADATGAEEPLHVYRRDGTLVQAYVTELPDYGDGLHERAASLLDVFAEVRAHNAARAGSAGVERRRESLLKRLQRRETRLRGERHALEEKRRTADRRDELRAQGEAIYAELHELGEQERESAKERATKLFAQYRKLGKTLPHVDARQHFLDRALEAVETLQWETQRAGADDLADVEAAVADVDPPPNAPVAPARKAKRKMLELRTESGSRILVGRSPLENAQITFRVARPHDVWFHVRGLPGAHVILARDDRTPAPPEDLDAAASLAAYHSKAQRSTTASVDYTLRKHVRKQRDAPPGLVWYTHAATLVVRPKDVAEVEQDKRTVRATG
jgi:predicted ribosome quality control (RQC) complex YloA/Tae2 family protein